MEFPSNADAQAARELLQGKFSEEITLRPKQQHPSDGNIATWRSTYILREELGNRTFGLEEIEAVMLAHNYEGKSGKTWISRASIHGVIERLSRGEYRFLPTSHQTLDPELLALEALMCQGCQPEPLQ